jgi:hypothetical protein
LTVTIIYLYTYSRGAMTAKQPNQLMESKDNCGVCGQPLIYGTEEVSRRCDFCGREYSALIYCLEGHYICDSCHRSEALDVLREVLKSTTAISPIDILETVMCHPSVPMHGPEHHAMVPAIIVAAVKNAGYPVPEGAVEKALDRGAKVSVLLLVSLLRRHR